MSFVFLVGGLPLRGGDDGEASATTDSDLGGRPRRGLVGAGKSVANFFS